MGPKTATLLVIAAFALCSDAQNLAPPSNAGKVSNNELKRLIQQANKPGDYQKLSDIFHYREELYRAKAQAQMDDYAGCVRNFIVRPKFPTHADQDAQLFEYYSARADEQARLAARYDTLLIRNGVQPLHNRQVISVRELQNPNALVPRGGT